MAVVIGLFPNIISTLYLPIQNKAVYRRFKALTSLNTRCALPQPTRCPPHQIYFPVIAVSNDAAITVRMFGIVWVFVYPLYVDLYP